MPENQGNQSGGVRQAGGGWDEGMSGSGSAQEGQRQASGSRGRHGETSGDAQDMSNRNVREMSPVRQNEFDEEDVMSSRKGPTGAAGQGGKWSPGSGHNEG
jgi:hypothetical protein